jgi:Spy/CpxP family protein refolding chaperone
MKLHKISLLAALAVGALFALTPTLRAEDKPAKPTHPEAAPRGGQRGEMLKEMGEKLNLTADQKTKLQEAFKTQRETMKDLTPEERREKMKGNRKATDAKIKEILTPEQYTQWEKQRQENRPASGAKPGKKEKPAN